MTHYCFTCESYPTNEKYEKVCKELGHDIDYEDQYRPAQIQERQIGKKVEDGKTELLEFVKKNILKVVVSSSDSSQFYGLVEINGHIESINLNSKHAISWLRSRYYLATTNFHSSEMYENVIALIRDQAIFSIAVKPTSINKRISSDDVSIYYDLVNSDWKLVKITQEETSIIEHGKNTPIFSRGKNQSVVSEPCFCFEGDPLEEFCKLVRMENDPIFKVHLISMFVEHIPSPIMVIIGQEGSAKSIRSALIKKLVDPSGDKLSEQLSQFSRNIDDLNVHFSNNYMVVFDNVSHISPEISDTLCKAITGAGYPKRQNYSDAEEIILKFQRKIIINGISVNIEHGDLARRSINYFTDRISQDERKTNSQVIIEFKKIHANLLGQIFFILSKAIRHLKNVVTEIKEHPDMADFALWGESINMALGNKQGTFLDAYSERMKQGTEILNENNPAISFFESQFESQSGSEISDSVGKWFGKLESFAHQEGFDRSSRNYPKNSNRIRGWIERSKPLLHQVGFEISFTTNTSDKRWTKHSTIMVVKKIDKQERLS